MSESPDSPVPYRVSYSEAVQQKLSAFADEALDQGLGEPFLASLKEFDSRLRVYPQFGDPLADLKLTPSQLWIGVVWPVVMRYTLDDQRRLVIVVAPFLLLPKSAS